MVFMKVLYVLSCPPACIVDLNLLLTKNFNSAEYWGRRYAYSEVKKNILKRFKCTTLSEMKEILATLENSFVYNKQYMS